MRWDSSHIYIISIPSAIVLSFVTLHYLLVFCCGYCNKYVDDVALPRDLFHGVQS